MSIDGSERGPAGQDLPRQTGYDHKSLGLVHRRDHCETEDEKHDVRPTNDRSRGHPARFDADMRPVENAKQQQAESGS